jgi:exopolysaccharide production protein ExoZ
MPRRQIFTIQYYRAIAAGLVVIWHTGDLGAMFGNRMPMLYGFMMITGFLTFQSHPRGDEHPIDYVGKRMIRLAPVYWIATGLVLLKARIMPSAHGDMSLSHIVNSLLFIPDFNARHEMFPVLVPGWYLFYDVWLTILLGTMLKLSFGLRRAVTQALLIALLACGIIFHPQDPLGFRATDQILSAMLAGMVLHRVLSAWRPPRWQAAIMALAGFALYWLPYDLRFAADWPILVTGLPTLVMIGGVITFDQAGDKPIRWLVWLGDASMSIYIWHLAGILIVGLVLAKLSIHGVAVVDTLEAMGGIALGAVLYPSLERPLTRYLLARFTAARQSRAARTIAASKSAT